MPLLLLISYSPSPFLPSALGRCNPSPQVLQVFRGLRLLLSCVQLSPQPCSWEYPPHRHTRQHNSDLEVVVTDDNLGNYVCTCQVWSYEAGLCLLSFCHFLLFLLFFFLKIRTFFCLCYFSHLGGGPGSQRPHPLPQSSLLSDTRSSQCRKSINIRRSSYPGLVHICHLTSFKFCRRPYLLCETAVWDCPQPAR